MKKYILSILLSIISLFSVKAQLISPVSFYRDGLSIGLKKNKSLFLEYGNRGFNVGVKQTIFVDKTQYQFMRIEGGYTFDIKFLDLSCDLFYTSDWRFDNYNVGSQITLISRIFDKYGNIGVRYIPYYDAELNINHGWSVSGKINITKDISFVTEYGQVPDYRIAYKRLYMGAVFKVNNLSVYPILEIPIYETEPHLSHSQIVVSMCYTFGHNLKKQKVDGKK